MENLYAVVVTYNRADFLRNLLDSFARLDTAPARILVVDNAGSDHTPDVVAQATAAGLPIQYERLDRNIGGAGGFSRGVELALESGAEWLWLMDDDVEVLPGAVEALEKFTPEYSCMIGRRYDANGKPFFWQHHFVEALGIFLPVSRDVFRHSDVFRTNVGNFEGMLINASVARSIGLPDPRFFITWDDLIYGWLAAQETPVVYVNAFVIKKVRAQRQVDLGLRHLNDSSDLSRRYVMRNRGHVAHYLRAHGKFNPAGFAVGTALTFLKELVRLVLVERTLKGAGALWRGWRESRTILADAGWKPMPPLPAYPGSGTRSD
ncbi:glycosyl transferase 2 family protein [Pseudarthrobacter siccitolerans]|uniref:Glycosyl transferase 2 family protein n=1 Tax=Pseudarthrobacter siccitolerans TaxID=861266 RepID=A0A024H1J2_9MICC|nr:glycosyltransferase [Pseudarthrobacter siccitolerans]CCQ45634.1 glycosyl transferase 2 family protein [Pseudarthrobacter siccitolerans]